MKLHIRTGENEYPIVFNHSFESLQTTFKEIGCLGNKICIITDDNVDPLYGDIVENEFLKLGGRVIKYSFLPGEDSKNLEIVEKIYSKCLENQFDRQSVIVALGGGIVGDVAGFVASSYMRGIKFIQIPTTLLAQNDSSVGGKVGVNYKNHKNMIGAFYQPQMVYMNTGVLSTLSRREFASGMSEIIKHGLIRDESFYNYLINNVNLIKAIDHNTISYMNYTSCSIKGDVVSQDEKEGSIRKILNFGHTIGHAIETLSHFEYLHGEGVSLGMVAAAYISRERNMLTDAEFSSILNMLHLYNLPTKLSGVLPEDIYNQLFYDKKVSKNTLIFILLKGIGNCVEVNNVTKEEILNSISYLQKGQ
ncbi:MAG TPA: 3-dehydroquinate synthase [Epulopiscium sp.]|nr:3-dehydroquinate synthase [Candidatus Epulonipiscium sp.]